MGHSDIGVTLNTYTHLGLEDAQDELGRIAEIENARREMDKLGGEDRKSTRLNSSHPSSSRMPSSA